MANQSSIFPIFLRAEYRDDGQGFARFQSDAQRTAMAAKREFEGVRTALDQALSRPRNTGGSLDLGVEEMRQAAMAQQQIAAAAREVANATKAAATANGAFDAAMSRSTRAAFELANAEERVSREMMEQVAALEAVQRELNQTASATDLVTEANRRGTTATSNVINSQRASRTAFIQLGQQLQDVAVQAQMGTSAFLIFGQQAPQAAFALTGLADSANRTQAAIGRFATFMSGPWGAAIFVAVAALGPFVQKLFETQKAADLALDATKSLAEQQQNFANFFDLGTGAILEQNSALIANARLKRLDAIDANNEKIKANRAQIREAIADSSRGVVVTGGSLPGTFQSRIIPGSREVRDALARAGNDQAAIDRELAAIARSKSSAAADAKRIITLRAEQVQSVREVRRLSLEAESLEAGRLQNGLLKPNSARTVSGGRGGSGGGGASGPSEDQIARFQQQAAERVNQINDRFAEQTRLVTQSLQANRQIDQIIAQTNAKMAEAKNLTEAQREEFEGIIEAAASARDTIDAALVRPFEDLQRESDERLQIEQLLAQGRTDEAAALQIVLQLQRQIGTEAELRAALERAITEEKTTEVERIRNLLANYNDLMDATKQRVIDEQRITRELRDQQQVFNAQLDVLGTVRRDLTDILSGRSTDFFGNFRQALQDLQGQRLFETIFGDTFRQIENELQANSPQGKANEAYRMQVEKTADTTAALEESLFALASTASGVSARMAAIASGRAAGAANDNGSIVGGITVTANRRPQTDITTRSTIDLATRISRGIGESIGAQLEEVLGPRFAAMLGDIVGGAIAGKVIGGTAGSIIGGLQGLTSSIKGLEGVSAGLGAVLKGIGAGTQVNALGNALGVKGSKAGSQIGGVAGQALGTLIGGPVGGKIGALIGALGGNLLGGLLKSTPRASATIGGVGSALGLSSVTGTSGSLRDAAGGLGNSVLETVNRIAQQLGASINASAGSVSIGQRKDNLRVDTTGRGITKIGNGAIDFGDDAEAAVAFAVRDLIQDGVITGLRQSEQNLLRAGKDIETALSDVMRFRGVFDQLREIKDPLGFAIEQLNREFDGLIDLFERAGASAEELGSLEELYNLRRAEAIRDATDRVVGSLRQLLNELTIGDSGLSLRSRRANAASQFDALAARVAAGDATAFDDFADISQQLLDIERQLFGSTQSYFDRLAQVTALTERAIQDQTNVTSIAAGSASPFGNQVEIDRSIDVMNANLGNKLDAIINNQILAISSAGPAAPAGSGIVRGDFTSFPIRIANF